MVLAIRFPLFRISVEKNRTNGLANVKSTSAMKLDNNRVTDNHRSNHNHINEQNDYNDHNRSTDHNHKNDHTHDNDHNHYVWRPQP